MEPLVEVTPIQALHLWIDIVEQIVCPVDDGIKVSFDLVDVHILTVRSHITIYIAFANPFQGGSQELLTISRTFNKTLPALNVGVLRVGELRLTQRNKRAAVNGVQFFLFV